MLPRRQIILSGMLLVGAGFSLAQAEEVILRPGATVQEVETIADMLSTIPARDALYFRVAGFRAAGDGGGGVFLYEKFSIRPSDGGTVFAVEGTPGRFVRQFDPEGEVYAEWFGAYGDGVHDDQSAINACLAALGRVKLLAKTYGVGGKPTAYDPNATYHAIDLGPGYRIEGSGRDRTTIRLLDGSDPKGTSPTENYFNVLGNREFHTSADYVIIRDLTIDCNFDGQNKQSTINAIGIRGGGVLVERCNFRGYGTGRHPEGSSRECFVVHQSLVYKDPTGCRQAATYRDLDFTAPGHNGDLEGEVAEITHITLGGAHNFEDYSWITARGKDPDFDPTNGGENEANWWPSYGGLVENCTIHDETYDPATQKSPLHGITYGDCIGLTIRNNRIENFEGTAVYVMSWWNRDTTIVGNQFKNVNSGVALQIHGVDGRPYQAPRHENVILTENTITLGQPAHSPYGTVGVQLYGQSLGKGIRFDSVMVRNNTIMGRAYLDAEGKRRWPTGISFQVLGPNYQGVVFENNIIDVPDYSDAVWVPQEPHSLAMTFFPLARWEEDTRLGKVIYRANVTPDQKPLYPILADWSYKNSPVWGKPLQ